MCAADRDVGGRHVGLQTMERKSAAPTTSCCFSKEKVMFNDWEIYELLNGVYSQERYETLAVLLCIVTTTCC